MQSDNTNFVINTIDRFRDQDDEEGRIRLTQELMAELGGSAVNIGLIDTETSQPVWVHSSMSADWMTSYIDDGHYLVDPFFPHLKNSMEVIEAKCGSLSREETPNEALLSLNWGLKDAGYTYLAGLPFSGDATGLKRMITFCSSENPGEFVGREFRDRLNCLSTIPEP